MCQSLNCFFILYLKVFNKHKKKKKKNIPRKLIVFGQKGLDDTTSIDILIKKAFFLHRARPFVGEGHALVTKQKRAHL